MLGYPEKIREKQKGEYQFSTRNEGVSLFEAQLTQLILIEARLARVFIFFKS